MRLWATALIASGCGFAASAPSYTASGELIRPPGYREWVYLSSGIGMTYGPAGQAARNMPPLFDNVFVAPEAYSAFLNTGRWPDKTMFILEIRYSQSHGSINKGGHFQTDVAAMEAAVKDEQRFPEKWAYFDFPTRGGVASQTGKPLAKSAGCFACHSANGAVENSFVQFYPTLLEAARQHGTVKSTFKPWSPSPARLYHLISSGDWSQAQQALNKARVDEPDALIARESAMNQVAYQLLSAGHKQQAISLLKFAVSTYPGSANLADSLSETYEANGQKAEAIEAAQRCLALLDRDTSIDAGRRERLGKAARERIARLEKTN
jgi:tetratricopeptide (TPR) repeat protein